jgi:DNA invertase Pin-like site-specific DNA recombinase
VVLDMPLLDTRTDRDLTSALISDIVLQLLSYVAQTEREFIHQRQAEGIAAARLRGVHLGRKALPIPAGFPLIYDQWKQNCITSAQASKQMGLTMNQFIWMRKKYENCSKYAENPFRAGI